MFIKLFLMLVLISLSLYSQEIDVTRFIKAKGRQLVVGISEEPIRLRGTIFHNDWWADKDFIVYQSLEHSEIDYQRVANMGMNVIRFGLTYKLFEDDANPYVYHQEAWDWLDQEILYAKKWDVYLILDMHRPQIGFQEGNAEGNALWENVEYRNRLKALWKAIAARYKNEPTIAAYDLINEPFPLQEGQWETFAQELIDEIRTEDMRHLIIVEKALNRKLFLVSDSNVMYDAHAYYHIQYCLQYNNGTGDGGKYPDPDISVNLMSFDYINDIKYRLSTSNIPLGNSDWQHYESDFFSLKDTRVFMADPHLVSGINQGTICFDALTIEEFDRDLKPTRKIQVDLEDPLIPEDGWAINLNFDNTRKYKYPTYHCQRLNLPNADLTGHGTAEIGKDSNYCITIGSISNKYETYFNGLWLSPRINHTYKISGWMKGIDVTDEGGHVDLVFYTLPRHAKRVPFDKTYLETEILKDFGAFGIVNNVPLNAGEFGLMQWCFNRGGLQWVEDMVSLFDKYEINYQYTMYHISTMGIYTNINDLPDFEFANEGLISLFKALHAK